MKKFKQDNGQAGLTILLSVIVMLFIIGLIIMIFSIMSAGIQNSNSIYEHTASTTVGGEAVTQALMKTATGDPFSVASYRGATCEIVAVYNSTGAGAVIAAGNYTEISECAIKNLTSEFSTVNWAVNYTYRYYADTYGTQQIINDTSSAVGGATDWFGIFIVITAMVVLILLTVIIITAIRGSGMIGGSETSGANRVGTA